MKTIYFLLFFTVTFLAQSQQKISVKETNENIGGGSHNALTVTIYGASQKDVAKAWKDELKKMGAKVQEKKEIFGDDALIKSLSENTFDIYSKVEESGEGVITLIVAVDLGGAFMNSSQHPDFFRYFKDKLYEFAVNQTKAAIAKELKEAQKEEEKLNSEYENLIKEKEKLEKAIKEYEEKIKEAKENIEKNKKQQEEIQKQIVKQKEVVKAIEEKMKSVK
jgi:flagellar biosynthesis GTPase FlhF